MHNLGESRLSTIKKITLDESSSVFRMRETSERQCRVRTHSIKYGLSLEPRYHFALTKLRTNCIIWKN